MGCGGRLGTLTEGSCSDDEQVNGVVTFEDGECTGATSGQLLLNRQVENARESAVSAG